MNRRLDLALNRLAFLGIRAGDAIQALSAVGWALRMAAWREACNPSAFAEFQQLWERLPAPVRSGRDVRKVFHSALACSLRSQAAALCVDRFEHREWSRRLCLGGEGWEELRCGGPAVVAFLHTASFPMLHSVLRGHGIPVALWRGAKPWLLGCYLEGARERADRRHGLVGTPWVLRIRDGLRPVFAFLKAGGVLLMALEGFGSTGTLRVPVAGIEFGLADGALRVAHRVGCPLRLLTAVETRPFVYDFQLSGPLGVEPVPAIAKALEESVLQNPAQVDRPLLRAIVAGDAAKDVRGP